MFTGRTRIRGGSKRNRTENIVLFFSSLLGGDARDWPGIPAEKPRPRIEVLAKAIECLEQLKIPTIAAVQGGCMGGGFELALSCGLIIAGRNACFAFPEALVGIPALQGGVYQLAERVGRAKAIELVLLSDPVSAEQMAEWNVVNRVVDDAALASEVANLAQRLAAGPTKAYAATKALLDAWRKEGSKGARAVLYDLTMPLFGTADVQTALRNAAEAMNSGKPFPKATFTV